MENNVQNKETNIRRILNNIRMLFQGYLTFKKEETNDSSARHTTVLYSEVLYSAVLAVWDGWANAKFVFLLKATKRVYVAPRALVSYLF